MTDVREDLRSELSGRAGSARLSEEFSDRVRGAATRRHRNRRVGTMALAASVVVIALGGATLALRSSADDGPTQVVAGPAEDVTTDAWVPMPDGPLSPRDRALAFTVGDEVLIFGGSDHPGCYDAGCPPRRAPTLVDGAAYDPTTRTWRSIADAPTPIYSASGAVIGDRLYLWAAIPCPPNAYCMPILPDFLIYDAGEDAWSRGNMRDVNGLELHLVAEGDRIVGYHSEADADEADLVYDPATDSWAALPVDPLQPGYNRAVVPHDGDLFLFSVPTVGSVNQPDYFQAAVLEADSNTWRELPESRVFGSPSISVGSQETGPTWAAFGDLIVSPTPNFGPELSDETGVDLGGIFDTASETWAPLPQPPAPLGSRSVGQVAGHHHTTSHGWIYTPLSGRWTNPPHLDGIARFGNAVAWVDDTLVVWGGTDDGEPTAAGASWTVRETSEDVPDGGTAAAVPGRLTPELQAALDAGAVVAIDDAGETYCTRHPAGGGFGCGLLGEADPSVSMSWNYQEGTGSVVVVDGQRRLDRLEVVDAAGVVVRTVEAEDDGLYLDASATRIPETIRIVARDSTVLRTLHPIAMDDANREAVAASGDAAD